MDTRNTTSNPSRPATVVEASTLKEALRQVRARYGEDARVIRSRSVTRRQPGGLGREKVVEVLVEPGSGSKRARGAAGVEPPGARPGFGAPAGLTREIAAEVERIEDLVRQIAVEQAGRQDRRRHLDGNPVAEALVAAGAYPGVVVRLCDRYQAETGGDPRDRAGMLEYLTRSLPTGRGGWDTFEGVHAFLGAPGAGRTEMVLGVAARLVAAGRQVLVLSLLPRHGGDIRRLQAEAARHGYDAAVIQKPRQLAAAAEHVARYDVVLLDAPAFGLAGQDGMDVIRREIVQNPDIHRHLVFPLDRDLRDSGPMLDEARAWNCDWLAVSRVDQTGRRGKILDLVDRLPLPMSVVGDTAWPAGEPDVASADSLTDLILGAARRGAAAGA